MNLKVNFECDWVDDVEDYENLIAFLTNLKTCEIKRQEILNAPSERKKKKKKKEILEIDDAVSECKVQEDNFVECVLENILPAEAVINLNNPYEKMNVKQLRELCKEKKLSGYSKLTRENLILKLKDINENES